MIDSHLTSSNDHVLGPKWVKFALAGSGVGLLVNDLRIKSSLNLLENMIYGIGHLHSDRFKCRTQFHRGRTSGIKYPRPI